MDGLIPWTHPWTHLGVPVEYREHDEKDCGSVVTYQVHDVFIVPEIESTLCLLEMWAADTLGKLAEEWFYHFAEL